ncbi:hypothetical protein IGI72_003650 [Enterococcus sp. DIV1059_2]|nr:hypothetical protein A5882_003583 [Enterococcus sp. 4E1_DIV0656]
MMYTLFPVLLELILLILVLCGSKGLFSVLAAGYSSRIKMRTYFVKGFFQSLAIVIMLIPVNILVARFNEPYYASAEHYSITEVTLQY